MNSVVLFPLHSSVLAVNW